MREDMDLTESQARELFGNSVKVVHAEVPVHPEKLDLGCGDNKKQGFTGVDKFKTPSVDIVCDLLTFPWPFKDESIEEIHSAHFFEHVPQTLRAKFMEEIYRILKPGAKAFIICPYAHSHRSIQDATHEWPPICETSFLYFNANWRKENKLEHGFYDIKCDFDFAYGFQLFPDWQMKSAEALAFALKHYLNVAQDIHVTLTKK